MTHRPVSPPPAALARVQIPALVASGVLLWALAALLLHAIAPLGALQGHALAWVYAATVPGTWPALWAVVWFARLQPGQVVPGIALVTLVALLIDGVVFGWFPEVYASPPHQVSCAAAVLWGAGCGLALAFLHEYRATRPR